MLLYRNQKGQQEVISQSRWHAFVQSLFGLLKMCNTSICCPTKAGLRNGALGYRQLDADPEWADATRAAKLGRWENLSVHCRGEHGAGMKEKDTSTSTSTAARAYPRDTTQGEHHKRCLQLRGKSCTHSPTVKINHAQGKSTGDPGSISSSAQATAGCLL